jgi:hypothetical protein
VEIVLGDERGQRHNMLVTGAVGQGESNFLKVFVHSLATRYSPQEVSLYLLDLKEGVTFYPLASTSDSVDWLPQAAVIGLESDGSKQHIPDLDCGRTYSPDTWSGPRTLLGVTFSSGQFLVSELMKV